MYNEANKAYKQADNFIFNIDTKKIKKETAMKWAKEIFEKKYTRFVKRVVLFIDGKIEKVMIRKK